MRTHEEMLGLILDVAGRDDRIRAVVLNGSRANPHAAPDPFQDYDVVYLVTDVTPFRRNFDWIRRFGELMILQTPDDMEDPPPSDHAGYAYLMQFADGNRIDLGIFPVGGHAQFTQDSLSVLLLDKDGAVGPAPPPSDRDYLPKPPTAKQFADCCNEFWWVCPYVAKGLWRDQIVYAKYMLDQVLRTQLMRMLTWHTGLRTGFSRDLGGFGKYLPRYLEPELWEQFRRTYADASCDNNWEALFAMCSLFRNAALAIAQHFGFEYPIGDDGRGSAHLKHVRELPRDAMTIY
jgi:aminoglycoside 6-adenylyltransferase